METQPLITASVHAINSSDKSIPVKVTPPIISTKTTESITLNHVKDEIKKLNSAIGSAKREKERLYKKFMMWYGFLKGVNTIMATIATICITVGVSEDIQKIITAVATFTALILWSNLSQKATAHLTDSHDLQTAMDLLNSCTKRIATIQQDGIVTLQEQTQIADMVYDIDDQISALSACSRIANILTSTAADPEVEKACKSLLTTAAKYKQQQKA